MISIVPAFFVLEESPDVADDLASRLASLLNGAPEADNAPRRRLFLCEDSPTTEIDVSIDSDAVPHTLRELTCDHVTTMRAAASSIRVQCETCGSEDVRRDASVAWNVERQSWELAVIYEKGSCEDCGCYRRLVERHFEPSGASDAVSKMDTVDDAPAMG